ncbi:hypothetical protein [Nonomuraea sp. NPDC050783]|uniref:hypothetical protein n=1 Tax=Nonomuraea sp. NPDC050783 TaxID=3154634 RepID=UPI0034665880
MSEYPTGTGRPASPQEGTLQQGKEAAREVAGTAKEAAREVAGTAVERTAQVADEAKAQTRRAVDELRDRVRAQSEHQSHRAAQSLRQWSEDLAVMQEHAKPDSPVSNIVRQVADQGQRAADYLEHNGLAGVVSDVQRFARRRPAAFLAGALAAGFLVGRIVKASGESSGTASQPQSGGGPLPAGGTLPSAPGPYVPPEPLETTTAGDALGREETRPVTPPPVAPPVAPPAAPPAPPTYGTGSQLP